MEGRGEGEGRQWKWGWGVGGRWKGLDRRDTCFSLRPCRYPNNIANLYTHVEESKATGRVGGRGGREVGGAG